MITQQQFVFHSKKYKLTKIIKIIKKRTRFGSYNQINSYYEGFRKSKGQIIFLDSDDFFEEKD